jgi:NADP-dependent 3-hydroxy acid dehydrogenase YdfG
MSAPQVVVVTGASAGIGEPWPASSVRKERGWG